MLTDESVIPIADEVGPINRVEVGIYANAQEAFEHGLVVLAMGRAYWTVESPEGPRLLVEADVAERVRGQLKKFEREQLGWPPPPLIDGVNYPTDVITPLLWSAAVLGIFQLQMTRPAWAALGAVDAAGIVARGEWWRVGTALWLHGDGAHVVSNALSGALLFTAVLKTFGRWMGWLLVAVAAVLANAGVAVLAYPEPYRSLGASTAIFAGLGLLTGRMVRVLALTGHLERRKAMFVALGSGIVVFAMYGAGGGASHVDLGAHVAGFSAGLALGFLAAGSEK